MEKTVWITGASSGIGREFARRYAAMGCRLILTARRADRLTALAEELNDAHGTVCRILPADLPDTVEKVNIMFDAIKRLTANGYRYIGMDHFAKETDELSVAQKEGSLQRNFQGYSTKAECDMIALGVSSISKIGSAYACNPRELEDYYAAIREGRLATNRGYLLNADDEMRRYVIMTIMCNFELRKRCLLYTSDAADE